MKLHVASGAKPLLAVQFTVETPTGNVNGDVMVVAPSLQVMVGLGGPLAVGLKLTEAEHCPAAAVAVRFEHDVNCGAVPLT